MEFKVRHYRGNQTQEELRFTKDGIKAFCKDTVALAGFDLAQTVKIWKKPASTQKLIWVDRVIAPLAGKLARAKHLLVSIYVELDAGGAESRGLWKKEAIETMIESCAKARGADDCGHQKPYSTD